MTSDSTTTAAKTAQPDPASFRTGSTSGSAARIRASP